MAEFALTVSVMDRFVLQAGTLVAETPTSASGLVRPPTLSMVEQVIDFLEAQEEEDIESIRGVDLAHATVSVCLRYGTWLALLGDEARRCPSSLTSSVSQIHNTEMARINVEASAGVERWLEIRRKEPERFCQLVLRAVKHLPLRPTLTAYQKREVSKPSCVGMLIASATMPEMRANIIDQFSTHHPEMFEVRKSEVHTYPTRVLSNALVNAVWRNGPVEEIHAGKRASYPIDSRRMRLSQRDYALQTAVVRLAVALPSVDRMIDQDKVDWPQKVLPFHLMSGSWVTPSGWSLNKREWDIDISSPI